MSQQRDLILGAGMTGLAAGLASGLPVFEAAPVPGGICSSYYVRPGERERLAQCPPDEEAYHFELGGGHWIFGGDPAVLRFIEDLTPARRYNRRSAVYLRERDLYVPYPLQNHLRYLGEPEREQALAEMARPQGSVRTMSEWLERSFGPTLGRLFFQPFHELYTAGLSDRIAPQDGYKSPVDMALTKRGASTETPPVGYNAGFVYPAEGLNTLAGRMAERCDVRFGKRVEKIDPALRSVDFADGSRENYRRLISTLPLNRMMELCGLSVEVEADPYTSVLVLNIGAVRGPRCPEEHWLYNPDARSGFHRVGFYSNVDPMFLPKSARDRKDRVSIYVERTYRGGEKPSSAEVAAYSGAVIAELRQWGYIGEAEVADPTWIDVAYTWAWPGSRWREQAMRLLESHGIYPVGRYGRWVFQGIADSIRDGFFVGASFRAEAHATEGTGRLLREEAVRAGH